MLIVKKRIAWKPACPCAGVEGPVPVQRKLLVTATQKAPTAAAA